MPTLSSVHVSVPLTNLAKQYKAQQIVADRIFPVVPVEREADKYYVFQREELILNEQLRAPGAYANEVDWNVTTETYSCNEYALSYFLPKRVEDNSDAAIRPRITAVKKLESWLQLGWESRVKELVTDTSKIGNTSPTVKWDAASGQNPEKDVDTAKNAILKACGVMPNTILMNTDVAAALRRWLKLTSYTEYRDFLAVGRLPDSLWDLDVIVASAHYNASNLGQEEDIRPLWPDSVIVFYREASPSLDSLSFGYTLRARDFRVKTWEVPGRDGTMIEVSVVQAEVLVAPEAGYILTDVLT